jgi:BirA family biotin operon repressor/biotin-[acetyl-CoA-carboxylase] ligase
LKSESNQLQAFVAGDAFESLVRGRSWPASDEVLHRLDQLGLSVLVQQQRCSLPTPPTLLDIDWVRSQLTTSIEVQYDLVVESTNRLALAHGGVKPAVYLAEFQSHGRGRGGRQWISPFGANLMLSFVRQLNLSVTDLAGLSLAIGSRLVGCLRSKGVSGLTLKWPNDLLVDGHKTAGILIEIDVVSPSKVSVVVGIGLNVEACPEAGDIGQTASKLRMATELSRSELAAILINELSEALADFEDRGLEPILKSWSQVDGFIGQSVCVVQNEESVFGKNLGIDERGNLLLQTADGLRAFSVGDVSLRSNAVATS